MTTDYSRRSFLKFLGVGAATAATAIIPKKVEAEIERLAPEVLDETPPRPAVGSSFIEETFDRGLRKGVIGPDGKPLLVDLTHPDDAITTKLNSDLKDALDRAAEELPSTLEQALKNTKASFDRLREQRVFGYPSYPFVRFVRPAKEHNHQLPDAERGEYTTIEDVNVANIQALTIIRWVKEKGWKPIACGNLDNGCWDYCSIMHYLKTNHQITPRKS